MKRLIITLLAFVPLGAAAQSRAIEALATKYADREGFSTTVVKGDISTGFVGSLTIESVDISNIIKDISSIIVIRSTRPDEEFTRAVNRAVAEGYSTVLSSSSGGEHVRFLLSEDRDRENEFVIAISGDTTNILVSIVGNYTLGKVSKPKNK
jgi:hypothetical protein